MEFPFCLLPSPPVIKKVAQIQLLRTTIRMQIRITELATILKDAWIMNPSIFDLDASIDDGSCMSFETWEDWILEVTKTGIDTNLGVAHFASDSASTRDVYFFEGQDPNNGKYPEGTMIFKHIRTIDSTQSEYVGMVKQEKGFNQESNDWEWFVLNANGKVQTDDDDDIRGANIFSGYCTNCHISATTDMVFSK